MSKKIIAALLVATMLFVCVFAACNKNKAENEEETTRVYADATEFNFVTDEDGNRVYTPDGEFIVYVTDEDGKVVTNESGEAESMVQQFVPIVDDNRAEYYGYSITLPEGWSVDETKSGSFVNNDKQQKVSITAINKTYSDYYESNKAAYEELSNEEGMTATWEEGVALGDGCARVVRFTLKSESAMNVMYFFVNNGNLYKILFEASDPATAVADSEAICAAVSYKPYQYFETEVTDASDVEESVWESIISGETVTEAAAQ
ncbi:MAG: hypothetical protein IKV44_00850 [Clostridia bacterium]|nr:hypothetical protein [Clostridia bacterium]